MKDSKLVLLDTNVVSELVRPVPNSNVVEWIAQMAPRNLLLSTVSVEEIAYGIARVGTPKRSSLQKWFNALLDSEIQVEPIVEEIALRAGTLRGTLSLRGKPRQSADILIAATALLRNATLATRNTKDFADCGLVLLNPFEN